MRIIKFFLSSTLFLSAFVGDYIVFKSKYSDSQMFRAIADSLVHGFIGYLSASLFFCYKLNITTEACLLNVMLCTAMSSVIDIDHVFVAKSFYLKDLTNLSQRGIFHCTTFWVLITALLFTYSYIAKRFNIYVLTFMLILAFTSHHVRDGNRRGLWLYPFGHTPPLNKYLYALLLSILPNVLAHVFIYVKQDWFKNVIVDYTIV